MRKERTLFLTWLWAWICVIPLVAQQPEQLPIDPKVRYGKLSNGLTYYIRHNELPKERADFYIAQKSFLMVSLRLQITPSRQDRRFQAH